MKSRFALSLLAASLLFSSVFANAIEVKKLAPALPGPPRLPRVSNPTILALIEKNKKYPTTKAWRTLAEYYVSVNRPADAAAAYHSEAALHRRMGSLEAAMKIDQLASRYETDIKLFLDRPLSESEAAASTTKAVLEPPVGVYLGAYIDQDDALPTRWMDENGRWHRNAEEFTPIVGKAHATYFMYMGWGSQFPYNWIEKCKKAGAIPHIALEPHDIDAVQNDAYLQNLAKEFGRMNWPIFLRYASEMNGKWTKWHGDSKKYREKFRLVNAAMKKYAPQVATVWCPNAVPLDNIMEYYPGDDAVDWVGINVYSVPFYDNDPRNPAMLDTPAAYIEPIYKVFADRKPIAICEYGASQMAVADNKPRPGFAIEKMAQFYSSLPRLFPRVKMISWFDVNAIKYAPPGRQKNNYSLSETKEVTDAYRKTIASPYFIAAGGMREQMAQNLTSAFPRPVKAGQIIPAGTARFSAWVKTGTARPKVYLQIGKKIVYGGQSYAAHEIAIDTKNIPSGRQPVTIYVFDELNRFIASRTLTVSFGNPRGDEPLQVAGNVLHYFADASVTANSGYVSAMQIENSGEIQTVYFAPELASQLLEEFPEGAPINAWIKPYVERGSNVFKLAGIGEDKPDAWLPEPQNADATSSESTLDGDQNGKVKMKAAPKELSNSLLMQSREVRMAGKSGLVLYAPKLARERGGEEVPIPKLMNENMRPW